MGMFDTVTVVEDNKLNLPVIEGGYQTQWFDNQTFTYRIDVNGRLEHIDDSGMINEAFAPSYREKFGLGKTAKIIAGRYTGAIHIYGYSHDHGYEPEGKWLEFGGYVIDNQIVYLELYGDKVYTDNESKNSEYSKLMVDDFRSGGEESSHILEQSILSTKHLKTI